MTQSLENCQLTPLTPAHPAPSRGGARPIPLRALWVAGAAGGLAQSVTGVAGTLLARRLGHSDWVAGLPQALLVLGSASAAVVLSRVMARGGRRPGLVLGGVMAFLGSGAGIAAAGLRSVVILAVASLLLGWGTCAVMFARYAAADSAGPGARARLLASVLAAIAVGAVAGPNLLTLTARLDRVGGMPAGSGAYLVAGLAFAAATLVWLGGRRGPVGPVDSVPAGSVPAGSVPAGSVPAGSVPAGSVPAGSVGAAGPGPHPAGADEVTGADGAASVAGPAPRSRAAAATGVLGLANLVMVASMTMAPVQMQMHDGSGLSSIGLVVSAHIAAMFVPSPLSGRLADRAGERFTVLTGGVVLAVATGLAALTAGSAVLLATAMVLVGLGWNISTVAASSMLTRDVPVPGRARLEGRGEIGMGVAAAVGGGMSGLVMADGGYPMLACVGLVVVLAGLVPLALRIGGRRAPRVSP